MLHLNYNNAHIFEKKVMGILSFLGFGDKTDQIKLFLNKGAIVIDVRNYEEFAGGHIQNAKNIPLQIIDTKINEIKNLNKPVIVCCQSGMRSAKANSILKRNGIDSLNGGGWKFLENNL